MDHQYGWTCRIFPLLPAGSGKGVLWSDAERAYVTYKKRFGEGRSLEELAERGGFGVGEFVHYFHGIVPALFADLKTDRCGMCDGSGEVVQSDEGGIVMKCGVCMGAGAVLPKATA